MGQKKKRTSHEMRKNIKKTIKEEANSRPSEGTQETERKSKTTMDGGEEENSIKNDEEIIILYEVQKNVNNVREKIINFDKVQKSARNSAKHSVDAMSEKSENRVNCTPKLQNSVELSDSINSASTISENAEVNKMIKTNKNNGTKISINSAETLITDVKFTACEKKLVRECKDEDTTLKGIKTINNDNKSKACEIKLRALEISDKIAKEKIDKHNTNKTYI